MTENEALRSTLEDLIDAMQFQTKELERIVTQVEGQTTRLDPPCQLSIVASELSELHNRIRRLSTLPQSEASR